LIVAGSEPVWVTLRGVAVADRRSFSLWFADDKIAEQESTRKETLRRELEHMWQILGQLEVIKSLPDDVEHTSLTNRAIDVRSAMMLYLAVEIEHSDNPLGIVGVKPPIYEDNYRSSFQ
jgi:hypothetical protein